MGEAPHGTVSFLFTDVEGSTSLWEECPDAMRAALAAHDHMLRSVIGAHGGYIFSTAGDAFSAAFWTPEDALGAALAGQRRLAHGEWPEPVKLSVRMGVHTGTADERDGDYFGPAVNRAARLMAAGHGGEVLVSLATEQLIRDRLPEGVGVIDLGEHLLAGLSRPERVFQLTGPGLRCEFLPLRSVRAARGNVPRPRVPFVGREVEQEELTKALARERLVTITGPGGMGKTALALRAAAGLESLFPGGTWLVELAAMGEANAIDHAVAAALGAQAGPGLSSRQVVIRFLAAGRALLVLDNCEHVVDAAADLVDELVGRCPDLVVLTTSRQPLGVAGERMLLLGPLLPDDQVALFEERASAVRQAVRAERAVVEDVCRQLDGMPLAIELATARLRSMTVTELAQRLPHRFRLLAASRGAPPRHRTLEAVVAWSFDQLTPPEQQLFERLSVFAGDFDLTAAHTVCVAGADEAGDELDTLAVLDGLVDKSLVVAGQQSGRSRYLLLETLRHYGQVRLSGEAVETLRDRHASYYVDLIPSLRRRALSSADESVPQVIDAEFANIRAAFRWAVTRGQADLALSMVGSLLAYAELHPVREVAEWVDEALGLPGATGNPRAARAHLVAVSVRQYLAEWPAAERHARAAIALDTDSRGEPSAASLLRLAPVLSHQGRLDEAAEVSERALALARSSAWVPDIVGSLFVDLVIGLYLSRPLRTNDTAELVALGQQSEDVRLRATALNGLGQAALVAGDPEAVETLRQAAALAERCGHDHLRCMARVHGAIAQAGGEPRETLRGLRVALVQYGEARIPFGPRTIVSDFLPALAALSRWRTIALIDGAAPPTSIFGRRADAARGDARAALGDTSYEETRAQGNRMTNEDFESFLHAELDALGVQP